METEITSREIEINTGYHAYYLGERILLEDLSKYSKAYQYGAACAMVECRW
jgi:hypothetical protein